MLNPFERNDEGGSYVGLKKRILSRMNSSGVDGQVVELLGDAYIEALKLENVKLAREEKRRLQADVLKLLLEDAIRRVWERGGS